MERMSDPGAPNCQSLSLSRSRSVTRYDHTLSHLAFQDDPSLTAGRNQENDDRLSVHRLTLAFETTVEIE